jgi:hypothetical protein
MGKVSIILPGLYAQWRARYWAAHTLAERSQGLPLSERLLQLIWQHQRLRPDQLRTTDGRPVQVLHPGFWNHEAGPDFRDSVILLGQAPVLSGDVEVDLVPQNWHAHRHHQNPAYQHVVLHVVWEADPGWDPSLPTLALKTALDAPLEELVLDLSQEPSPLPVTHLGRCSPGLRDLPEHGRDELLHQAAQVRLQAKAGLMHARAKQVGWQQALWEGLFGALGYKNNFWPMRRISEALPALISATPQTSSAAQEPSSHTSSCTSSNRVDSRCAPGQEGAPKLLTLQARLLGVSGLLPHEVTEVGGDAARYLRSLWNVWWREREQFAELTVPRTLWRLHNLRPANHPQRRLALAAHWLAGPDLPGRLEKWFASVRPDSKLPRSLLELLQPADDPFWSRHWTVSSARIPEPQPLIGPHRVTDLAINVILPWFWSRAAAGQNESLQHLAEQCYFAWPNSEDNSVLRLTRTRLFGSAKALALRTAALQQGLLQITRDFCDRTNALCDNCPFPGLIEGGVP